MIPAWVQVALYIAAMTVAVIAIGRLANWSVGFWERPRGGFGSSTFDYAGHEAAGQALSDDPTSLEKMQAVLEWQRALNRYLAGEDVRRPDESGFDKHAEEAVRMVREP